MTTIFKAFFSDRNELVEIRVGEVSFATGGAISLAAILVQRNWASAVYPWLADK